MFFSSAIAALNKPTDEVDDDEEEDVFKHTREVTPAKTYSIETAVRYVYGQGFGVEVKTLTDEEKEANERASYCRKQLLRLKARRAAQEAGEQDTSQILQREAVEEWLADIELRLLQHSKKLGIPAAQMPIWIAREKRKFGNIASAAKAAAVAIRLKLSGNELLAGRSLTTESSQDEDKSLATLNELMEELEELSVKAEESESGTLTKDSKRTVRFLTPRSSPFPTPRLSPTSTPRLSPSTTPRAMASLTPRSAEAPGTPRLSPASTPRLSPSSTPRSSSLENLKVPRLDRPKTTQSSLLKNQSPKEETSSKQRQPKTKKAKTSAIVVTATLRQSSNAVQTVVNSPEPSVDQPNVQIKRSIKHFVPRRRSTENI